jgi:hypothetical protein
MHNVEMNTGVVVPPPAEQKKGFFEMLGFMFSKSEAPVVSQQQTGGKKGRSKSRRANRRKTLKLRRK